MGDPRHWTHFSSGTSSAHDVSEIGLEERAALKAVGEGRSDPRPLVHLSSEQ